MSRLSSLAVGKRSVTLLLAQLSALSAPALATGSALTLTSTAALFTLVQPLAPVTRTV